MGEPSPLFAGQRVPLRVHLVGAVAVALSIGLGGRSSRPLSASATWLRLPLTLPAAARAGTAAPVVLVLLASRSWGAGLVCPAAPLCAASARASAPCMSYSPSSHTDTVLGTGRLFLVALSNM